MHQNVDDYLLFRKLCIKIDRASVWQFFFSLSVADICCDSVSIQLHQHVVRSRRSGYLFWANGCKNKIKFISARRQIVVICLDAAVERDDSVLLSITFSGTGQHNFTISTSSLLLSLTPSRPKWLFFLLVVLVLERPFSFHYILRAGVWFVLWKLFV